MKRYEIHMKLLEEFKKLDSGSSWKRVMETEFAQENLKVHEQYFLFTIKCYPSPPPPRHTHTLSFPPPSPLPFHLPSLQEAHLFLVCMSHSYPHIVGLNCDGCETSITGRSWYRDMDFDEDIDLCQTCFEGTVS